LDREQDVEENEWRSNASLPRDAFQEMTAAGKGVALTTQGG
jgi:hypothetical protein